MKNESALSFKKPELLQLPPGNLFTRLLTARTLAALKHGSIEHVIETRWPNDRVLAAVIALRAASAPAMTTVTGWAAELAQLLVADAGEALGAVTAAIEVMQGGLVLNWNGAGQLSVPAFAASANNAGFVAEGAPIPVRQFSSGATPIIPHKVASISVLTREMIESSNAEALISDVLVRSAALAIDAVFFGTAASSAAAPAGIRNGIAATTPSNNADAFGAVFEDVSALLNSVGAVGGKGPFYLVGNVGRIASMQGRFVGGDSNTVIPLASSAMGNDLVAIAPQAIAAALDVEPEIETGNAATLVMDTAPVSPGSVGPERSVWQTESIAIKCRWPVSWILRNAAGVAWVTPAWK